MRRVIPLLASCTVAGLAFAGCGDGSSTSMSAAPSGAADTVERPAAPGREIRASASGHAGGHASHDGSVLTGSYERLGGGKTDLSSFKGKVVLVVNTASQCGNTPQYEGLEQLYEQRKGDGLTIIGFPSGDFADQEFGSDAEIKAFCKKNFGVSFPMFTKSTVTGDGAIPLYRTLTKQAGAPDWNFAKYLVDRDGKLVSRWPASTQPDDPALLKAIDALV